MVSHFKKSGGLNNPIPFTNWIPVGLVHGLLLCRIRRFLP